MGSRRKARILAMQALYSWDANETGREELLTFEWVDQVPEDTAAFARLVAQGTIECLLEIDEHISSHLKHWELFRLARVDLAILRISTYALLHQPDIPVSVTIDEGIALAKEFGTDDSYKFVNGVLDSIRRDIER